MKQLRDYQHELVDAVWAEILIASESLAVLPTGAGKTVCISELIRRALVVKPTIKVGMIMGRVDLVKQTDKVFCNELGHDKVGVFCGSLNRREKSRTVTIASINSIKNEKIFLDILFIDETHNFDQDKGVYSEFIDALKMINPKIKVIGFTATPFRNNGMIYGDDMFFKKITYRKTIKELIDLGYLCEPILRGSKEAFDVSNLRIRGGEYRQEDVDALVRNEIVVNAQIKDALPKLEGRKSVVWACANIEHCNMVANELMNQGEHATTVHSKLDDSVRENNLSMFTGGMIRHMVFVSVLSEGFDHPPIDGVVLMRPTRSPVLYVQIVGRGIRIFEGKKNCKVLDYGQVVRTLGPLDDPNIKGKSKGGGQAPMKECPNCNTWVFAGVTNCPECEHEFPRESKPLDRVADHKSNILSEAVAEPEILRIGKIECEMHDSKSGNKCVKLTYYEKNDLPIFGQFWNNGAVREFFVITSPWAMERLERRLTDLDGGIAQIPFEGTIEFLGEFEITKIQDGKFDKVLKAKKIVSVVDEGPIVIPPLRLAEKEEEVVPF